MNIRRRMALMVLAATALTSVATSQPNPQPQFWETGDGWMADVWSDVVIHNNSDAARTVRLRHLSAAVDLDCAAISLEPGRLLVSGVFDAAVLWEIPPGAVIPASTGEARDCGAVLIDGEGLSPMIAFWPALEYRTWPGEFTVGGELRAYDGNSVGAITLGADDVLSDRDGLLFAPESDFVDANVCDEPDAAERVVWSDVPVGEWTLTSVTHGADGCSALDLAGSDTEFRWYLCASTGLFPFHEGDFIDISRTVGGVQLHQDETDGGTTRLEVGTSASLPYFADAVATSECAPVATTCGTVTQELELEIGGGLVAPGEQFSFPFGDDQVTVDLAWAQHRSLVNPACDQGLNETGNEFEWTALVRQDVSF
jgi:hypothetical protein